MATAAQVTKAALQNILVQDSESALPADEYQDTIFAMNNMLFAWDADGIKLGYTEVSDLGDDVTVPVGALRGIIYNLAIEMAGMFNAPVAHGVANAARAGMAAIRKLGISIVPSVYPGTLPIGSGNEDRGTGLTDKYYSDLEDQILAEVSGAIGLESDTVEG